MSAEALVEEHWFIEIYLVIGPWSVVIRPFMCLGLRRSHELLFDPVARMA